MVYQPGFIPLSPQLGKALRTELSAANADYADFAEKPAATLAWGHRSVSRMKITDSFLLLRKMDSRMRRGIPIEFRENIGLHLRTAGRALATLPWNKQTYRQ